MGWDGPLLTDSGGYQVFSLQQLVQVDADGATLRSVVDGSAVRMTPESAIAIQAALGADIAMAFDHCPSDPTDRAQVEAACERTHRWLERCVRRHVELGGEERGQALFGIVQGGLDDALRERSAQALRELEFDGYAVGGLSVGEESAALQAALGRYAPLLPGDQVRYVMGIGRPLDLLVAIAAGFDLFDSVYPTRNGRHGTVFTPQGTRNLRNADLRREAGPIDRDCDCPACRGWSVGALRHLLTAADPLARMLCAVHNVRFVHRLVGEARRAIVEGRFEAFLARHATSAAT
jgi:queuine tRNA-ribosyltransferase